MVLGKVVDGASHTVIMAVKLLDRRYWVEGARNSLWADRRAGKMSLINASTLDSMLNHIALDANTLKCGCLHPPQLRHSVLDETSDVPDASAGRPHGPRWDSAVAPVCDAMPGETDLGFCDQDEFD
jgi:hypothetical protein